MSGQDIGRLLRHAPQPVRDTAAIFLVVALLVACVAALVGASQYVAAHGGITGAVTLAAVLGVVYMLGLHLLPGFLFRLAARAWHHWHPASS